MLSSGTAMAFLPDKPRPKKARPNITVSYRPPEGQDEYLIAHLEKGWTQAEILTEMVGLYRHLETRLAPHMKAVDAFAVAEGVALPPENRPEHDTEWLREAIARLVVKGLEADAREREHRKPTKK